MKKKIILVFILLLATFLRFYRLNNYPALNADEAAIGYNAYSLIQTGKDEHANPWPIHFQSFNDYKPGLYFYIVLPFVKILGLSEWSVRIPGALLGIASVYLIYLFVKELFRDKSSEFGNWSLEIMAAAMLAVSPWHIHFSRGGWEVNVATFFIILGLWLLLKGFDRTFFLFLSSFAFSLSLYTYHAARLIVPLLVLGTVAIYWDKFKKNIKNLFLAGIFALLVLTPLISDFTRSEAGSRAAGVGLFADPGPLARINEQRGEHGDFTAIIPKLLHNKVVNYGLAFLQNLFEHFHGEFLFLSGDVIERNRVPETGQMYLFDILFILIGFISIIRILAKKEENSDTQKAWLLVIFWLLIAPSAAALTFQSPHALRAQNMVIPLVIISAFGLVNVFRWLNKSIKSKELLIISYLSLVILVTWNVTRYLHMYWVHMAKEYPYSSQYGVKELVTFVSENEDKFEKIIVTDRYDQPYILFLFYQAYSPEKFQGNHQLTPRDNYGFSTVRSFDKYEFRSIDYDIDQPENPRSLIVGTDKEIPDEANVVKEIYGTNGYKYFQIVAN